MRRPFDPRLRFLDPTQSGIEQNDTKLREGKGAKYVDLFSATADPATQRLSPNYSNDGLHLSAEGYRKVAETIFKEALLPLIIATSGNLEPEQSDEPSNM